jgi:uncharacterized membrane protein
MTLTPLLRADPVIQLHAFTALAVAGIFTPAPGRIMHAVMFAG